MSMRKDKLSNGAANEEKTKAAGDSSRMASFEEIVRRHQGMVYSLACHFLHDGGLAEDLAQEVFLDFFRKSPEIQSPDHLQYWLRKVTAHRCIDYVRRNRVKPVSLEEQQEPMVAASEADPLLSKRLQQMVATLPHKRRMVVLLRFQEEMELHEIAEVMEMPINTVKSYLQRSLEFLRGKLTRCLGDVTV
jgi:RNA polymerase sigma-70 factor, ECF subfamily